MNIEQLLNGMSLREKIGQTCQTQLSEVLKRSSGDLAGYLARYPVGSLFAGREIIGGSHADAGMMRQEIEKCQRASAIPLSVAGDLENGAGGAIRGLTEFPQLMALGSAASPELAYEFGRWTATEARQAGFNWTFGPVADLSFNWLNPILGTRCLGDRPGAIIPLLEALIKGFQENGLSATAKHFPGDGVDFRDQHLGVSINSLDAQAWKGSYGRIFSAVISTGVQSIMAGHIALPWRDAQRGRGDRPIPATVSKPLLTHLLREEMGFKGIIVSDALIMAGFTSWAKHRERTLAAFNAGIDVMLWPGENYFELMTHAVETGEVALRRLDESVRRILAFKISQGLFNSTDAASVEESPITIKTGAQDFAKTLAAKCLTLVRNRRDILPLNTNKIRTVLILYASARPSTALIRVAPFVQKLEARGIQARVHVNGNCLDIAKMEEAGERFDAFFCLFDQHSHDLKNTMRPTGEMGECLWTLQNTETLEEPVIISLGSPYLLNDMPYADTLVNVYSSDPSVLEALDKALFGEAGFPGHSPVQTGGDWVSREICPLPAGAVMAE